MARRRPVPKRGKPIPPPAWGCGEVACWAYRWQPVSAMGEYNHADVAMGDLEAHYAAEHPELVEEVSPVGHALAA